MWKAIVVTLVIFCILYAGIYVLKQSANKFKVPKNVKPQPYSDDDDWGKNKVSKNKDTKE